MRVLIDESLPRQLVAALGTHEAVTVQGAGWSALRNGDLLRRAAEAGFDVLMTADRNLEHQQNLSRVNLGVVVLMARTNRIEDLLPLMPRLLAILPGVRRGTVTHVGV